MRVRWLAVAALVGLVGVSCGSSSSPPSSKPSELTVLAASSLTNVFPKIGSAFSKDHPGVKFRFSFAGTDQLAAQLEQGAPADVFAGASPKYGDQLAGEHLIGTAELFCTNRLVVITPASNPGGITSLQDLATKPVKIVIGSEDVPIGSYTRTVLTNLDSVYGTGYADQVLSHVVSNEDAVASIVTKVQSGEADAGFVYVTDAQAAGSDVKTIGLPDAAQAVAEYPIAAVDRSAHSKDAQEFVEFVLGPSAQHLLASAGFGPPPSS
jgi:molybdate transport system substrate-binding protein